MFYLLSQWMLDEAAGSPWAERLSFLRLFRYITFRSAGAATTALLLSWWFGPSVIQWLKRLRFGQEYQDRAHQSGGFDTRVLKKEGTPTMGGILIIGVLNMTAVLWAQWNELVLLTLLSTAVLCGLGFYDDYAKIARQSSGGASSWVKLTVQTALALFIGTYLWALPDLSHLVRDVMVPFYKYPLPLAGGAGLVGLGVILLTIVGSSNAVNLTDGLDGLAIGCTILVSFVFLVLTYVAGNFQMAEYLQVPYVAGAGELSVFCAAMLGAGLGFLWYNCHPAQMFMGDTGSLALGGALGIIAVLIHQPFVLVIAGGVFVLEAGSVLLQTSWFKYTRRRTGTGQRLFRMAPLHHHFEKLGWYESQVTTRFYILGVLFGVLALATLKIR
jgi:phospho-N-acetylmuramoyl-pentapeptide-transferase